MIHIKPPRTSSVPFASTSSSRPAQARGVTFDVGLDRIHTSFAVVQAAVAEGFFPQYLSTDLTMPNRRVTVDMPTTISKFVALGMPLEQAIAASGYSAAVKLGMDKVFGVIREGNQADIGIFELQDGAYEYHDSYGNTLHATKRLGPLQTPLRRNDYDEVMQRLAGRCTVSQRPARRPVSLTRAQLRRESRSRKVNMAATPRSTRTLPPTRHLP